MSDDMFFWAPSASAIVATLDPDVHGDNASFVFEYGPFKERSFAGVALPLRPGGRLKAIIVPPELMQMFTLVIRSKAGETHCSFDGNLSFAKADGFHAFGFGPAGAQHSRVRSRADLDRWREELGLGIDDCRLAPLRDGAIGRARPVGSMFETRLRAEWTSENMSGAYADIFDYFNKDLGAKQTRPILTLAREDSEPGRRMTHAMFDEALSSLKFRRVRKHAADRVWWMDEAGEDAGPWELHRSGQGAEMERVAFRWRDGGAAAEFVFLDGVTRDRLQIDIGRPFQLIVDTIGLSGEGGAVGMTDRGSRLTFVVRNLSDQHAALLASRIVTVEADRLPREGEDDEGLYGLSEGSGLYAPPAPRVDHLEALRPLPLDDTAFRRPLEQFQLPPYLDVAMGRDRPDLAWFAVAHAVRSKGSDSTPAPRPDDNAITFLQSVIGVGGDVSASDLAPLATWHADQRAAAVRMALQGVDVLPLIRENIKIDIYDYIPEDTERFCSFIAAPWRSAAPGWNATPDTLSEGLLKFLGDRDIPKLKETHALFLRFLGELKTYLGHELVKEQELYEGEGRYDVDETLASVCACLSPESADMVRAAVAEISRPPFDRGVGLALKRFKENFEPLAPVLIWLGELLRGDDITFYEADRRTPKLSLHKVEQRFASLKAARIGHETPTPKSEHASEMRRRYTREFSQACASAYELLERQKPKTGFVNRMLAAVADAQNLQETLCLRKEWRALSRAAKGAEAPLLTAMPYDCYHQLEDRVSLG